MNDIIFFGLGMYKLVYMFLFGLWILFLEKDINWNIKKCMYVKIVVGVMNVLFFIIWFL